MNTLKVYLAGPMTGLELEDSIRWRREAADALSANYEVISPTRGLTHLLDVGALPPESGGGPWEKNAIRRDRWDVLRSDVVLANLTDAETTKHPSIGTLFEIVWAKEHDKFLVVVMKRGNPHYHAFVKYAASIVFEELDESLQYLTEILPVAGAVI